MFSQSTLLFYASVHLYRLLPLFWIHLTNHLVFLWINCHLIRKVFPYPSAFHIILSLKEYTTLYSELFPHLWYRTHLLYCIYMYVSPKNKVYVLCIFASAWKININQSRDLLYTHLIPKQTTKGHDVIILYPQLPSTIQFCGIKLFKYKFLPLKKKKDFLSTYLSKLIIGTVRLIQ